MHYGRNRTLLYNARTLRKDMTKEERHLWYGFLRYCRPRFRRQEIIAPYIADFYCAQARLVIEIDGSQHFSEEAAAYDTARTAFFLRQNQFFSSFIHSAPYPGNDTTSYCVG